MSNSRLLPQARRAFVLLAIAILLVISVLPAGFVASQVPPIYLAHPNPLRVMVPSPHVAQQLRDSGTTLTNLFPQMSPAKAFSPGPRSQPSGTFKALAILVQFSDNAASASATQFDSLLFSITGPSVNHFYQENSYGTLDIVGVTLPSTIGWQDAPQLYSYYVNGTANHCLNGVYPHNCQKLAEDIVNLVNPIVDFSQYDNNNDGYVDTVFLIHAGGGAENGTPNAIWSHSWSTRTPQPVDGKYVSSYTVEPEFWNTPGDITFGVFAHELGHVFGLPDLYDIDYTSSGIGQWSLMSGGSWNGFTVAGGDSPSNFDAWSRLYLGFTTPVNADNLSQTINLPDVETHSSGAIYLIHATGPGEYFLLENRQPKGFDVALPGDGLLIWHVDDHEAGVYFSNTKECLQVNNWLCPYPYHFRLALEQADGYRDLEYGYSADSGDPFPGDWGNHTFNFSSNPNSSSYYGSTTTNISVSNISASSSAMTAFVNTTIPDAPNAPPALNYSTTATPTLTWNPVAGAIYYEVNVSLNSTFTTLVLQVLKIDAPQLYETLPSSPPLSNNVYYWRVRACTAIGCGSYSIVNSFTVDIP